MKRLLLLIPILIGCSTPKEKSQYDKLLEYEGNYEYINNTTLDIMASEIDTILYAIVDEAKYPLKYIAIDSFENVSGSPVIFERDQSNQIVRYKADGQKFGLITKDISKMEVFPRKALYHNPDDYTYQKPEQKDDGITTGVLNDEIKNSEPRMTS